MAKGTADCSTPNARPLAVEGAELGSDRFDVDRRSALAIPSTTMTATSTADEWVEPLW